MNWKDKTIFIGDNLHVMRGMNSDSVDLIYLDPPFNSNRNYAAPIGSQAAGAAFKDTWTLSDIDIAEHGELAEQGPSLHTVIQAARAFRQLIECLVIVWQQPPCRSRKFVTSGWCPCPTRRRFNAFQWHVRSRATCFATRQINGCPSTMFVLTPISLLYVFIVIGGILLIPSCAIGLDIVKNPVSVHRVAFPQRFR